MANPRAANKPAPGNKKKKALEPYPLSPAAYVIFCDDVRIEDNGKSIFVGVYQGILLAKTFPLELPSFCVLIKIRVPRAEPVNSLRMALRFNGEELSRVEMGADEIEAMFARAGKGLGDASLAKWANSVDPPEFDPVESASLNFKMDATPFILEEEGVLRMAIDLNGRRIHVEPLIVRSSSFAEEAKKR